MAQRGRTGKNCADAPGFARVVRAGNCMTNSALTKVVEKNQRTHPTFRPGDTIRVHVKIKEGDKERLQAFEGTVIARNNTGMGETITVRKVSFGQGVERIFPLHARVIERIDVIRT